jgi:hypothetical protein
MFRLTRITTVHTTQSHTITGETAVKAAAALHAHIGNKLAALPGPVLAEPFPYDLMEITPEQLTLDEARAAATLLSCSYDPFTLSI